MAFKTIIFDFDGTLADCKELHQNAFREAVKQVSPLADFTDEQVEGRPTREKIRILHSMGFQFNGDKLNDLKQQATHDNLTKYIKYDPRLESALRNLSVNYKLCLASNATESFILRSLDIMRIRQFFDKVNTATDFPAKPDTTTFFDCMRYTGSEPSTTAIFEDSPVGIQCAKATGAHVIEVKNVDDCIQQMLAFEPAKN